MSMLRRFFEIFRGNNGEAPKTNPEPKPRPAGATPKAPKVDFSNPSTSTKPKPTYSLDDVGSPTAKSPSATAHPTTPEPTPTIMQETPPPPPQPSAASGAGEFEKAMALAGQRMDKLLAETGKLTLQLREAEKGRQDDHKRLSEANAELIEQQTKKDELIKSLYASLEQKAGQASVRALVEVRKLCQDLLNTPAEKQLPHDELVQWIAGDIDQKLQNLEVFWEEFPAGTPLAKIPGDQLESSPRQETTEDPAKANTVAQTLRPCYYLKTDSKRIIIAKASVVLYRFSPPTPATPTSSNPTA